MGKRVENDVCVGQGEEETAQELHTTKRSYNTNAIAPVIGTEGLQSTEQGKPHFAGESGASLHYSLTKHCLPAGAD